MAEHEMLVLGLSHIEEDVYRHLLRNPGIEVDDIHLLLRHEAEPTRRSVRRLRELKIIQEVDGVARACEPELVVARLAEQRLEELYDDIRSLTRLRPLVDSLGREIPEPEPDEDHRPVERLTGLEAIRTRLDELAFFAREEVLAAEPYDALTPENIENSRPLDMRCLRRGVNCRSLIRRTALEDGPTRAYLLELTAAGARIRVLDELDELMLVYDRRTALVPLDPGNTSRGALCSTEEGIVTTVVNNFERLWAGAGDLTALLEQRGESLRDSGLTAVQGKVLRLMCTVGKDEIGAREAGIALRTYRRHISDLMQLLGAENRAHAALLARERGWV
ncbi:helix-turn-helix transcriptional regulator [Streptomyces sp. HB132]|uniref:helix-turn-helix transcriptional regulator n=1 Tax=Streptomyces sp. HB132 TaxID=767388 RepID=UPI0019617D9A|nr:helix-turn-helix transcriptional regulator [Streptomyces sp. HB132]MBM7437311.1 DNA-binding CsgD family transcriptional regulator/predicted transcriptional regulator [Streptomyces sp. HB132]